MRRRFFLPLLIFTSSLACALPQAYFSPGGVQAHLVAAIDGTSRSLDVAIYELSAQNLIQALRRAGERGIDVRLLVDEETLREHPQNKYLANAPHVSLRTLAGQDKRRGMMHNKFAIFDHSRVLTGSYNWSQGAEFSNYENALFEDDPSIVRAYSGTFADLWAKARPVQPGFVFRRSRR